MSQKNDTFLLAITIAVIGAFLIFLRYLGDRSETGDVNLIPLTIPALILGTTLEYWRISGSVQKVLYTTIGSLLFSIFSLLPGKSEHTYHLANHIQLWPFVFLGVFLVFAAVTHEQETTVPLTEGMTLLLSISLIYLLFTSSSWWTEGLSLYLIGPVVGIFTLLSLIHAFTYVQLTPTHRMVLSVWSTIIMVILALMNISTLRSIDAADNSTQIGEQLSVFIQYFLLGVSAIYLMQHILMIVGFLPGRGTFFNAQYFREYAELKKRHQDRYSSRQVRPIHSLLAGIFCILIFVVNHYYYFVPPVTAIWLVLMVFPILLRVIFR